MAKNTFVSPPEMEKYLKGVSYPTDKKGLVDAAVSNGAPEEVLDVLEQLSGNEFSGPPEVMKKLGKIE